MKSMLRLLFIMPFIYGRDNVPPFPPPPKNRHIGLSPVNPYFFVAFSILKLLLVTGFIGIPIAFILFLSIPFFTKYDTSSLSATTMACSLLYPLNHNACAS